MKGEDVKSVVIAELESAVTTDFSYLERRWLRKYSSLGEFDKTFMFGEMLKSLNRTIENKVREREPIRIPGFGTFKIKDTRIKALQFKREELDKLNVISANDLPYEDRHEVLLKVKDKVRKYKQSVRINKNLEPTLKINVKKLAQQ